MSCECGKHGIDAEERIGSILGEAGLREIGEQALSIRAVVTKSVRALNKADRAAALNLGADVVRMYRESGERANRQARRQHRHLIERIDERLSRDDWRALVERERRAFNERGGQDVVEDAGARVRTTLLEEDAFSGGAVDEVLAVWNETADRLAREGLDGSMRLLHERLKASLAGLEAPEMGRQHASPDSDARLKCIAIVFAVCAVATAVCLGTVFCWCCYEWIILLALVGFLIGCASL
jgi:hypothetical protein